ncbi:MAG TPA: creatininase family protein [Methylomirabilota bacterium]|nr:creatininase family protein [Methylomirabilota bacterium]
MIRLAERTWPEAARLAKDPRSVLLLPLGAVEQHGPHLPLLVDWLGAEALADRIAPHLRRAGFRPILLPSLPYGASPLARGFAGTISLTRRTLVAVAAEIVAALAAQGFHRFVLVNYQADPAHLAAMAAIKRRAERRRGVRVLFAGFAPSARAQRMMTHPRVTRLLRSPAPEREWHSGEMETSLVLATRPRLVRRRVARRLPPHWIDFRAALAAGKTFAEMDASGRGYFGWPAAARAVTGRRGLLLRAGLIARELVRGFA